MSGVQTFTETQEDTQISIKKANCIHEDTEEKVNALESDYQEATAAGVSDALLNSSAAPIELASSWSKPMITSQMSNVITSQTWQTSTPSKCVSKQGARHLLHRYFISQFEEKVFRIFRCLLPERISASTAGAIGTKDNVLSTLGLLTKTELQVTKNGFDKAFVEDFSWVRDSWHEAVVIGAGYSYSNYQLLREFKDLANKTVHDDADSLADALLILDSPAGVPMEAQKYKEPLKAVLKFLQATK